MRIITNKKAFAPYLEGISAIPRDADDPVVTVIANAEETVAIISHPIFTLSFPVVGATIEAAGSASYAFGLFKKAMLDTKAKNPLTLEKDRIIQEQETFLKAGKPFPVITGSILPAIEMKADKLAPLFGPLTLFPKKDPLREWRGKVSFERKEEGMYLTQCNGIHLNRLFIGGDFTGSTLQQGALTPFAVSLLEKLLPLFTTSMFLESDDAFGFVDQSSKKELMLKFAPIERYPSFGVPAPAQTCSFHLNPIEKKPFEKVLMERLRAYRDEHDLDYPEIRLRFLTAPTDDGEFTVTACLNHGEKSLHWEEVVSTTSPFLRGSIPDLSLPAYDVVKALESVEQITSLKLTDRGALIESIDMSNGIQQATVFLHGIAA